MARSSQASPLAGLLSPSKPKRSGSSVLGWVLAIVAIVFVLMLAIGMGVDQQAQHHIVNSTAYTQHA
ncbi:MAG TPA: hypothetical protein VHX38_00685 [Pseudonocardiaceae bacterium]|jgi:hypothetical protein|nr:hypothetical protein [Pseudonocardiaceae bacterium]